MAINVQTSGTITINGFTYSIPGTIKCAYSERGNGSSDGTGDPAASLTVGTEYTITGYATPADSGTTVTHACRIANKGQSSARGWFKTRDFPYAIIYKPGSYGSGSQTTQSKSYATNITLKNALFTRSGYVQTGWSTSNGGSQSYALGATYTGNAALTLYPVWTPRTYTVTYDGNGATTGSMTASTATYGKNFTTSPNGFTKTGYTFNGWYENTYKEPWTLSSKGVYESGKGPWVWSYTQNITLQAQWTPKSVIVEYNKNDGSNTDPKTQKFTYGVSGQQFGYEGNNKLWTPTENTDYANEYGFCDWYRLGYKISGWDDRASDRPNLVDYTKYSGVRDDWINSKNNNTLSTQTTPTVKLFAVWDYNGTVRIYDGTSWKMAIPYINVDGTSSGWKMALPYVNEDGTNTGWKLCGG